MGNELAERKAPGKGHVPGLDGVRGLALAFVLLSHSIIYDEYTTSFGIGFSFGSAGVTIFFVLSGFLITGVLLREEAKTGKISLRLFYFRRALRLFPALWIYLIAVVALWLTDEHPHHNWDGIFASLLYVRNFMGEGYETDHLWSLSIEEQFYLIWPIVLFWLPRRNYTRLGIAV
jgi:peptidoglycan/LPS O-acetylase OafA/YrhL